MSDFNFVNGRVATGAAITIQADVDDLLASAVTHIIDCRAEFDDWQLLAQSGVSYLWNGTQDDGNPKPTEWFEKSISFALAALAHPKNKIYAHCAAGSNRGPSTAYAILRALGYPAGLAETQIRLARPQVGLRYKNDADSAVVLLGYA